jgi:predicted DNA-binding transcriptional regulator AlpA
MTPLPPEQLAALLRANAKGLYAAGGGRPGLARRAAASVTGADDLVEGGDPYDCQDCVATGEPCLFHLAWAPGWDACAAFMAASVNEGHTRRVGIAEIARLLGVSRPRVWQLRRRADFPAPAGRVGGRDWWVEATVRRWAAETGRELTGQGRPDDGAEQ